MKKILVIGLISASLLLGGCFKEEVKPDVKTSKEKIQTGIVQTGNINDAFSKDIKLSILNYYGLNFLSDTFEVDSKEKCLSIIKNFSGVKNNIDCSNSYDGKYFGNLSFGIYEKGNDFYKISLGENDLGGVRFLDDIYSNTSKRSFSGVYLTGNNLGLISLPINNKDNIVIKSKNVSLFKDTINTYIYLNNKTIDDFQMIINHKIKENASYAELKNLLRGDFPYEINLEHVNGLGIGDSLNLLKESTNKLNKKLSIFNKQGIYFADEWGSGNSRDILILTTDIPENKYFSEIVIYFINTDSYKNKNVEEMILGFVKELKWQDNFILD